MNTIDIVLPEGDKVRTSTPTKVFVSGTDEEIQVSKISIEIKPGEVLQATIEVPLGFCTMEYLQPRLGFDSLQALAKSEGYNLTRIVGKK
ncbi:MAG: hypothetical protein V4440_05405 [Pseudomonadota bacterium]